ERVVPLRWPAPTTLPGDSMIGSALRRQYERAMREAYSFARASASAVPPGKVLDCGSGQGHERRATFGYHLDAPGFEYWGAEWNAGLVAKGKADGLNIVQADLNRRLPFDSGSLDCVIAYSVLE